MLPIELFVIIQVLHYLETLRPQQLLEQMVCTAFKSSADILNKTTYGAFKLMKTKMDQLYATMASTLKSLKGTTILVYGCVYCRLRF